jgi:hypothetical protein
MIVRQIGGSEEHPDAASPAGTRTVMAFTGAEPSPSTAPMLLQAQLVRGAIAAGDAVVLSDESCVPDAAGISHCVNAMLLADGSTIVVRHPHDMMKIPCLEPGEHVRIVKAPTV